MQPMHLAKKPPEALKRRSRLFFSWVQKIQKQRNDSVSGSIMSAKDSFFAKYATRRATFN
jgi:hypothetical protein